MMAMICDDDDEHYCWHDYDSEHEYCHCREASWGPRKGEPIATAPRAVQAALQSLYLLKLPPGAGKVPILGSGRTMKPHAALAVYAAAGGYARQSLFSIGLEFNALSSWLTT